MLLYVKNISIFDSEKLLIQHSKKVFMKIESFPLSKLANAGHLQFMIDAEVLFNNAIFKNEIVAEYTMFYAALMAETESQITELGSSITRLIVDSDELRDNRYTGFCKIVEGNIHHFDSLIAESARKISRIIDQFGNPTKLPYNDETSIINSVITNLESNLKDEINVLGLEQWLVNLKKVNADFAKLMNDRRDEYAGRVILPMKKARPITDSTFKKITERINALSIVKGEEAYIPVIQKLNESISYFRNTIAVKEGKAKSGEQSSTYLAQTISN